MTCSSVLRRASVVLAVTLLAGCTGEAAPAQTSPVTSTSPPATTGPTPSPSRSAGLTIEPITTPPPVPADLKTPGQVGSKAAVEYFVSLYGYTLNTGDTSLLRGASTPTCEFCNTYASEVEAFHEHGSSAVGGAASIEFMKLHEQESSGNRHLWVVDLSLSSRHGTAPDGKVTTAEASIETTALLAVWTGGAWKIGKHYEVNEVDSEAS